MHLQINGDQMPNIELRNNPSSCDGCGSSRIRFYHLPKSKRLWPYVWACDLCGAQVGCHSGTKNPLGFMANKETRKLRADVHELLDRIWKSGWLSRARTYDWLAGMLELEQPTCHIAELTAAQLRAALDVIERYITQHAQRIKQMEQGNHAKPYHETRADRSSTRPQDRRLRKARHG